MIEPTFSSDDRAVSIAITHVLTIAITAILITGLLYSAGTLLETEREQRAQDSLETIGERLSSEISSVDRLNESASTSASLYVSHPREVSGSPYTVDLDEGDDCSSPLLNKSNTCLTLAATDENVVVRVPIDNVRIDPDASARGGAITIRHDGTNVSVESGHR